MNRLYVYRLSSNTGFAPCTQDGLLSLACCKPAIRRTVGRSIAAGEPHSFWILGIGGSRLKKEEANRWLYLAQITGAVSFLEYFTEPAYQGRTDCIYRIENPEDCVRGDHRPIRLRAMKKETARSSIIRTPKTGITTGALRAKADQKNAMRCYQIIATGLRKARRHALMEKYPDYRCVGRGHRVYEASHALIADFERLANSDTQTKESESGNEDHPIEKGF